MKPGRSSIPPPNLGLSTELRLWRRDMGNAHNRKDLTQCLQCLEWVPSLERHARCCSGRLTALPSPGKGGT